LQAARPPDHHGSSAASDATISSLLSQLNPSILKAAVASSQPSKLTNTTSGDLRKLTYQQALPYLARLSEDPTFRAVFLKLQGDQKLTEQILWDERTTITTTFEEKMKLASVKARISGIALSSNEIQRIQVAHCSALEKHLTERVRPAWDGLVSKHQSEMERLGVPTMFVTQDRVDRERQQKVMSVLENIMLSEAE